MNLNLSETSTGLMTVSRLRYDIVSVPWNSNLCVMRTHMAACIKLTIDKLSIVF